MNKSILKSISLASAAVLMVASLIIMPEESFEASVRGLDIWLEIVFPSLLPFLIISEMLIAFGVVKFLGVFLEPFMGRYLRCLAPAALSGRWGSLPVIHLVPNSPFA